MSSSTPRASWLLSPLVELRFADLDRMHRVNIGGTFVVDWQAARPVRSGGAIINFSSSVAKIALPRYTAYAATKGASRSPCTGRQLAQRRSG
jgi:3-oxoacyl-[acyl-carrier protein] reductase